MNLLRSQVPDPFQPRALIKKWCRMLESNQRLAIIVRGLPPHRAKNRAQRGPRGSTFELILRGAPFGS